MAVAASGAESTPSVLPPRGPTPENWVPPEFDGAHASDPTYLEESRRAYADDYNAILKGGVLVPLASSGFDPNNPPSGLVAPGVAIPSGGDEWLYDAAHKARAAPQGAWQASLRARVPARATGSGQSCVPDLTQSRHLTGRRRLPPPPAPSPSASTEQQQQH